MGTYLGSEYKRGDMLDVNKENYGPETNVCHFSTPDYSNKYVYYTSGNKTK